MYEHPTRPYIDRQSNGARTRAMLSTVLTYSSFIALCALSGCDDPPKEPTTSYEVSFISPDVNSEIGCGDDLDRNTLDVIDFAVSVNTSAPPDERDDLVLELRAQTGDVETEGFTPMRRTLTEGGRVIFNQISLPAGVHTLTAALLNGAVERASAVNEVTVTIDRDSPLCGQVMSGLRFVTPADGAVIEASDDLDSDLTNGLQVAVEVEVEGPVSSFGELVEVRVDNENPQQVQLSNGVARFESVTLPLSGDVKLTAFAGGSNGLIEREITVTVNASACDLTLTPQPRAELNDICDLGGASDLDPIAPGLQVELIAESSCERVVWTVNGRSYPEAEVVDGQARLNVTLNQGENTISAQAESANGLAAEVDTYVLNVDLSDPELSVDGFEMIGVNQRGLSEATEIVNAEGERSYTWEVLGFTSDLPEGSQVLIELDPPIEGAPAQLAVDAEGRFTLNLEGDYLCDRTLTLRAQDLCDGAHSSPSYPLCFDAVVPRLSISEPSNASLISADLDPEAEGLQAELTIRVEDSRPDVDYPIEVQCELGVGGAPEILSVTPVLKSALTPVDDVEGGGGVSEGVITVTFPRAERYTCRPIAMTGENEPTFASSTFRVITDEPTFEVLDPVFISTGTGRDYSCVSESLLIGGRARQFADTGTQLNFTLRNAAGQIARSGQLSDRGDGTYGATVELNPQLIIDGRYQLVISGVSGELPVSVVPSEPIELLIDNEPPVIGPLSPANGVLDLERDANADPADCIQSALEYSLDDASAEQVCFSLNGEGARCTRDFTLGVVRTPELSFQPGVNRLEVEVIDCALNRSVFNFEVTATGCQPLLQISDLRDGVGVTIGQDEDAEREGIQLTVALQGAPDESVTVAVVAEGSEAVNVGPVALDASGSGSVTLTLPVTEDQPTRVTLTPSSAARVGRAITVESYAIEPQLIARPLVEADDCLNLAFRDQSSATGLQARLAVDAAGIVESATPTFETYCVDAEGVRSLVSSVSGAVIYLGQSALITSEPITFAEGSCEVEVSAESVTGATLTTSYVLTVDLSAPRLTLLAPDAVEPLNLLNDASPDEPGIQTSARISVCDAEGSTLEVSTDPAQASGSRSIEVTATGDACEVIEVDDLTFGNGNQVLSASATDACGNTAELTQNIIANTGVALVVTNPNNQERISAAQDQDTEAPGCQLDVTVATTGFATLEGVEFALCASNQPGELSPLCGLQTDASLGACITEDDQGREISCPVTLTDGEHELSIVSRQNGVDLRSQAISVVVDCTPPSVLSIQVAEDLNDDSCVNSQERANFNASSLNATVNLTFEVDGLADGTRVSMRALPDQRIIGQVTVSEGRGSVSDVSLTPGEHQLYLTGTDEVGNTLPLIGEPGFVSRAIKVDTVAPAPVLLRPNADECLGLDDDALPEVDAQYQPRVETGVDEDEVSLTLSIDGVILERVNSGLPTYTFNTINLSEGEHALAVTAEDLCGNVGSIAGFNRAGERPNWLDPIPVEIEVDLTPPTLSLSGVDADQVFMPEDDANGSTEDGFQVNVVINVAGLEAGREVQVLSGAERLPTIPVRLLSTGLEAQQIPVTITLPPGPHTLTARASDECDNPSVSADVSISIDVDGCTSRLTGLTSGQLFSLSDGPRTPDGRLRLSFDGVVDLLDPACANAQAELILDGGELLGSSAIDDSTGVVSFTEVSVPEGSHQLAIRVRLNNEETSSLGSTVRVDITAPSAVEIITPELTNGAALILDDSDPTTNGQQFTLIARVTESPSTTALTARLSINGVSLPNQAEVSAPNAQGVSEVRIDHLNAPLRRATYQLCMRDEASNERCASFEIDADPAAPNGVNFTAITVDARIPLINVSFTAPGDDLSGGDQVAAYEARWSSAQIPDELAWSLAAPLPDLASNALPGSPETLTVEGLPPNAVSYLAIRARDDVGRLGPLRVNVVDTRLNLTQLSVGSVSGDLLRGGAILSEGNMLSSIGDFDGDGYDDLVVGLSQGDGVSVAQLIFGGEDLSAARVSDLNVPASLLESYFGIEVSLLGDVNGDGAPDLGVAGYSPAFSSQFAIFFGCPLGQPCDPNQLKTHDVLLTTTSTLRKSIASAGDFAARLGAGYDDIIIGGGQDIPDFATDPRMAVVIEGRADWPATIEITSANEGLGVYALSIDVSQTGIQVASAGDLDGDGASEVLISAGGNIDRVFVAYGGAALEDNLSAGVWSFDAADQASFLELSNPCDQLGSTTFGTLMRGGADLDGDGVSDFVIGNRVDEVLIVMNQDLERLDCIKRPEADFSNPFDLAGDINGDGAIDLIAANRSGVGADAERVYVLYNNGEGQFGSDLSAPVRTPSMVITRPTGDKLAAAGAGDMNQDGARDLAVLTYDEATNLYVVSVLY